MKTLAQIKVVAEIGCNHKGDMSIARKMIQIASQDCGVDVVKFQKRCNRELLSEKEFNTPHPVPANAYGPTYGAHREFLEFDLEQHRELQAICRDFGVEYSTSVWDLTSAREITSLQPSLIKIPSATNQNFQVQDYLCRFFEGEIHVSTGMTTTRELETLIDFYEKAGRARDLVLYACTSGYPVAAEDVCLLEIDKLQRLYGRRLGATGFSGHHLGTAIDMAAAALGLQCESHYEGAAPFRYIERHFTLDKTWKGTDHSASLEPDEMRRLCEDLRTVQSALRFKDTQILDVEVPQRHKLKWREMERQREDAELPELVKPLNRMM
ncbi:Sialic acid synthase SpsE, contains C-terminal SAF domain [Roseibium suaedae]|uniref:Sialic acid synthase SpsE, contains C-terminal SAF domain n=2 Tax=Roseibium suaedae TaxID=735517 RepID=A0A1M7D4I2_9HYPH|nr:Sialic acid synthase SpsE, contains C-terminal SAF domain [Roseibium suaedae]